ncbi:MAG: biotin--[acetyl-CoA-carboxylase] ligase [Bacteroidales bacterium]|nr:biotin--[acetyl-CoA-carboxylase] ligase [Bacteroidales bacterium]
MSVIIWHDELDSTNMEAHRRMADLDNMSVIAARWQSAGRGQRGNTWSSDKGENLTFSIVLKYGDGSLPAIPAASQHSVSMAASLALVDFLADFGISAGIKWPNDIYVSDRKICGMLIEHTLCGSSSLKNSIIGIGLNLNQHIFDPSIPNPTSMSLETGCSYDCESMLEEFVQCFAKALPKLGCMPQLEAAFLENLWRKDELHTYVDCRDINTEVPFKGIIRGITPLFRLIVENEKGELVQFSFKELRYII